MVRLRYFTNYLPRSGHAPASSASRAFLQIFLSAHYLPLSLHPSAWPSTFRSPLAPPVRLYHDEQLHFTLRFHKLYWPLLSFLPLCTISDQIGFLLQHVHIAIGAAAVCVSTAIDISSFFFFFFFFLAHKNISPHPLYEACHYMNARTCT